MLVAFLFGCMMMFFFANVTAATYVGLHKERRVGVINK